LLLQFYWRFGTIFTRAANLSRNVVSGAAWKPGCPADDREATVTVYRLAQFDACRLVAAALSARDPAAIFPLNRCSYHAAALSWADGDTTGADANCGVGVVPATVPIIAVAAVLPDLNIDALGHLDALGFGWVDDRGSRQHRCGCRHGKSNLHHVGVLLGLDLRGVTGSNVKGSTPGNRLKHGGDNIIFGAAFSADHLRSGCCASPSLDGPIVRLTGLVRMYPDARRDLQQLEWLARRQAAGVA
jgi:hypothetical protein